MWGTCSRPCERKQKIRFIPTHVGYIHTALLPVARLTVHPHACGVHVTHHNKAHAAAGSSPRMWGTCQGQNLPQRLSTVHPHACGVHPNVFKSFISKLGSSPRMWGTSLFADCNILRARFIPTHVGYIESASRGGGGYSRFIPTHVGYILARRMYIVAAFGSSPRMWGT